MRAIHGKSSSLCCCESFPAGLQKLIQITDSCKGNALTAKWLYMLRLDRVEALQALDVDLQEAEDQQLEAQNTHLQTLGRLVEMQTGCVNGSMQRYEDDRKVPAAEQSRAVLLFPCTYHLTIADRRES